MLAGEICLEMQPMSTSLNFGAMGDGSYWDMSACQFYSGKLVFAISGKVQYSLVSLPTSVGISFHTVLLGITERRVLALFNVAFLIFNLHASVVVFYLVSLALMKVFLWMASCPS